jgi:formylglycine-generating enzyme required for sulfatase activity
VIFMKKPIILIVLIIITQVVLACTIRFTSSVAEIELTATREPTASPTIEPAETPLPEPTLGIGSTMANPVDGALLVYVPEGEFLMGSEDEDANDNEKPKHLVYLDAYWIYQHQVTNEKYRACVNAGECRAPNSTIYYSDPDYNDHPAVYVRWFDADAYCQWAGGRLPTEAEWEKAARGEDGHKYPWGDDSPTCDLANFSGCVGGTSPVGSYPYGASPYGALDLAGNVWEWVADWYDANYYINSPHENPPGPETGTSRVLRGGSGYFIERFLRVSFRDGNFPGGSCSNFGFRCVRSP